MADEATGENRPQPKQEANIINLVCKDQTGTEVHFKVKLHTKLEKVFAAYCAKKSIDVNSVRFVFDGSRVQKDQTPQDLGMDDGDTIDVFQEQIGGGGR